MRTMASNAVIVAHRGLHQSHPENSLAAFKAGWDAGVQWCECDVHASADGVPFVIHDPTLDRTTTMKGLVNTKRSDELAGVIPTLAEVISAMPEGCGLLIEIKPAKDAELVRAVLDLVSDRRCIIQSFDVQNIRWSWQWQPALPTALLIDSEEELSEAANQQGPWQYVCVDHRLLALPSVSLIRGRGTRLGAWTVNTPEEIARAMRLGAELIITDQPLTAMLQCSDRSALANDPSPQTPESGKSAG